MNGRIVYGKDGTRTYYVEGKTVSKAAFDAAFADKFGEMVASGQTPGIMTDSVFLAGLSTNGSQFEKQPWMGDYYKRVAEAQGQDVTGKVYLSGLARAPGDPEAWVSGRGDVERVCAKRGLNCSGAVNVKSHYRPEPEKVDIADDLIEREANEVLAQVPEPHKVDKQDLKEQIKDKRKASWMK